MNSEFWVCFHLPFFSVEENQWSFSQLYLFFFMALAAQSRAMASSFLRFFEITLRHTTVGRTPLDEWSARRTDLYQTTHNTHNRQTSMPPAGFEPKISAGERPQTYGLDRAATGTGFSKLYKLPYFVPWIWKQHSYFGNVEFLCNHSKLYYSPQHRILQTASVPLCHMSVFL